MQLSPDPSTRLSTDMTQWMPSVGGLVNMLNPGDDYPAWRRNCVEVDNPRHGQRLILDFSDPLDPRSCGESTWGFVKHGCARERCDVPKDVD